MWFILDRQEDSNLVGVFWFFIIWCLVLNLSFQLFNLEITDL